jgi:hypothetical protein
MIRKLEKIETFENSPVWRYGLSRFFDPSFRGGQMIPERWIYEW